MVKKIFIAFSVLVLVVAVVLVGGVFWIKHQVTSRLDAATLVRQIEASNNCRVHIGAVTVSLFSQPARLELSDLRLLPRDEAANSAVPLAERDAPPELETTGIVCGQASLASDLRSLWRGRVDAESIGLRQVLARTVISRDGTSSLNAFFDEPPEPAPTASARFDRGNIRLSGGGQTLVATTQPGDLERFNAEEIQLPATLESFTLEEGVLECFLEKTGGIISAHDLEIALTDLDIDAANLAEHNSAKLSVSAQIAVEDGTREHRYANLIVRTDGDIVPFEPATGYLNPNMAYVITVAQGSFIEEIPLLKDLGGDLKKLAEIGVKLEQLGERHELQADSQVHLRIYDGRLGLAEPLLLPFSHFALTLKEGSWIETAENTHQFDGHLLASREMSAEAVAGMEAFVRDTAGDSMADIARGILIDPILVDGRISLDFASSGELADPKVKIVTPLSDIGDVLKKVGGQLLKGLFGN
ncbi:hypothetical protein BH23VER1_BH23VER1_23910 [soil metagenome]